MINTKSTMFFARANSDTWGSLLTLDQASQVLNVSPWTLRKWDGMGKLVAVRVGSRKDRRYRKEDILEIVKNGV